jgi:hypothetical protein
MDEDTLTFLFSGYARLPQDVSHQAMYKRVGVVLEVDAEGVVVAADTTLMMPVATGFFARLLVGRSVLSERPEIEATVRYRYRGHSQGALLSALHKAFEAIDQSPLVAGAPGAPASPAACAGADEGTPAGGTTSAGPRTQGDAETELLG